MGVTKQTGNSHVPQINDKFLKDFDRVWAGAFFFLSPFLLFFFFFPGGGGWRESRGGD